ncbi:hypothetical protein HK102_012523, partial [Quaeritorhiza haematococci]
MTTGATQNGNGVSAKSEKEGFMDTYDVITKELFAELKDYKLPDNGRAWIEK